MTNKSKTITITSVIAGIFLVTGALAGLAVSTSAQNANSNNLSSNSEYSQEDSNKGPFGNFRRKNRESKLTTEQRDAYNSFVENNDFAGWQAYVEENIPEISDKISEDNFNRRVEAYKTREAIDQAVEANDYQAFVDAVTGTKAENLLEKVTAENFDRFVELHNLREENRTNQEQIREIAEELGLNEGRNGFGQTGDKPEMDDEVI